MVESICVNHLADYSDTQEAFKAMGQFLIDESEILALALENAVTSVRLHTELRGRPESTE